MTEHSVEALVEKADAGGDRLELRCVQAGVSVEMRVAHLLLGHVERAKQGVEGGFFGGDEAKGDRDWAGRHRHVASAALQPFGDLTGWFPRFRFGQRLEIDPEDVVDTIEGGQSGDDADRLDHRRVAHRIGSRPDMLTMNAPRARIEVVGKRL